MRLPRREKRSAACTCALSRVRLRLRRTKANGTRDAHLSGFAPKVHTQVLLSATREIRCKQRFSSLALGTHASPGSCDISSQTTGDSAFGLHLLRAEMRRASLASRRRSTRFHLSRGVPKHLLLPAQKAREAWVP